jgi:hypothetical protein
LLLAPFVQGQFFLGPRNAGLFGGFWPYTAFKRLTNEFDHFFHAYVHKTLLANLILSQ